MVNTSKAYQESGKAMFSDDYKERFWAEYVQLQERRDRLFLMLQKWEQGKLEFTPTCPKWLLENQRAYMDAYLLILEERAEIEKIALKP